MAFNYFTFDGRSLEEFGFVISKMPDYEVANRKQSFNYSNDLTETELVDGGYYENVKISYIIKSLPTRVHCSNRELVQKLVDWLMPNTTYHSLSDSFTPNAYTKAVCTGVTKVQNLSKGIVSATVSFSRQPFWYIDNSIEIVDGANSTKYYFENPTKFSSKPLVIVRANLNSNTLRIDINEANLEIPPNYLDEEVEIIFDTQTGNISMGGENINYRIVNFDYTPTFSVGTNTVLIRRVGSAGTIPYIKIDPRWKQL